MMLNLVELSGMSVETFHEAATCPCCEGPDVAPAMQQTELPWMRCATCGEIWLDEEDLRRNKRRVRLR